MDILWRVIAKYCSSYCNTNTVSLCPLYGPFCTFLYVNMALQRTTPMLILIIDTYIQYSMQVVAPIIYTHLRTVVRAARSTPPTHTQQWNAVDIAVDIPDVTGISNAIYESLFNSLSTAVSTTLLFLLRNLRIVPYYRQPNLRFNWISCYLLFLPRNPRLSYCSNTIEWWYSSARTRMTPFLLQNPPIRLVIDQRKEGRRWGGRRQVFHAPTR